MPCWSGAPDYLREMPMPFAVFRVEKDEAGRPADLAYVYANEATEELGGLGRADMVGRSYDELFPNSSRELLDVFGRAAYGGEKQHFTFFNTRTGQRLSVQAYCPKEGYVACVLQDVTERAALEAARREERERLVRQATLDPLTGLYHVGEGRRLVERKLARPRAEGAQCAFFMFDVDDFKLVNDLYGHRCGDDVLKGFARLLSASFRSTDVVYRAGGDEFAAFIADMPCSCVAERICADVVRGVEALSVGGVSVSVSIGVFVGDARSSLESLYHAADKVLYGIKRAGKSTYRIQEGLAVGGEGAWSRWREGEAAASVKPWPAA